MSPPGDQLHNRKQGLHINQMEFRVNYFISKPKHIKDSRVVDGYVFAVSGTGPVTFETRRISIHGASGCIRYHKFSGKRITLMSFFPPPESSGKAVMMLSHSKEKTQ